ncbi:unnamed protein product, partial [Tetraodon nigroviridis]
NEWNKNDERLLAAVEHGEAEKLASLLSKKGSSAAKLDNDGKSALHVAAARGQSDCLAVLLAHSADLTVSDAAGLAPLHLAARNNHLECCRKLLQVGGSPQTALLKASGAATLSCFCLTFQSKSPVDAADVSGRTALHHAASGGNTQVVQLLCEFRSPVNLKDADGLTPLLCSAKHGHADACAALLDCGADIDARDNAGRTALMLASESNALAAVEVLIQRGADLSSLDSQGHDVGHYAKLSGSPEIQTALNRRSSDSKSHRSPQHDQVAKLSDERITTPKKRKAPPPPLSPQQVNAWRAQSVSVCSSGFCSASQDRSPDPGEPAARRQTEGTSPAAWQTKHPTADEDLKESSRPNSMTSNSSFHSTQDELDVLAAACDEAEDASDRRVEGESGGGGREEAKLTDTQERYHQAVEEVEELRAQAGGEGRETAEKQDQVQRCTRLEQEVAQLRARLVQEGSEQEEAARRIRELEEVLGRAEEERQRLLEEKQKVAEMEELYKEAQEEIRILQEALRGTVPVEAAARDFEEMKAELNQVISGLQRRLLELSHSYSETRSQLSAAEKQLVQAPAPPSEGPQVEELQAEAERLRRLLADAEKEKAAAQEETLLLRQEAEAQAQSWVALSDHTQVVSSLGNAIKEAERQAEALKEDLHQKTLQVETLQDRLAAASHVAPADAVPRAEHEGVREQLAAEVSRLTQLLQGALRKQDEMALDAADAWQKAREDGAQREALQELVASREQEKQALGSRLAEAQDAVCQLKQLVENHVASEREKNKRIDDLSREVAKLKEALNSLSQLSYSAGSPSKRQQQNQQLETLQAQVKHLQYQLAETKKQHQEIVSVYRMHLLYAVQGQMDEDVQKALKQILMMCKMSGQA